MATSRQQLLLVKGSLFYFNNTNRAAVLNGPIWVEFGRNLLDEIAAEHYAPLAMVASNIGGRRCLSRCPVPLEAGTVEQHLRREEGTAVCKILRR
jgi:hypothetical protein